LSDLDRPDLSPLFLLHLFSPPFLSIRPGFPKYCERRGFSSQAMHAELAPPPLFLIPFLCGIERLQFSCPSTTFPTSPPLFFLLKRGFLLAVQRQLLEFRLRVSFEASHPCVGDGFAASSLSFSSFHIIFSFFSP